jgi:DNA adenine methylase
MPTTDSPLRYPGGKSQLTPLVIEVLRTNDLFYGQYAEPFAGGAGIACTLLLEGYVSRIHINDLDPSIYAFWWAVVNEPERFCRLVATTPVTIEEWHRQRSFQGRTDIDHVDLGFSTFFLNRTNRSGIILGGVIGGLEQKGNYLIDCRFHKLNLTKKIERIALNADKINVTNLDALAFLKTFNKLNPASKTLINIDPPYYVRGPELYRNWFTDEDHKSLAKAVGHIKPFWMVTYDNTVETQQFYSRYPSFSNSLRYTAQVKRIGVELLVMDPRLKLPPSLVARDYTKSASDIRRGSRVSPALAQ